MARQISRAAGILGYSGPDWMELSSAEKKHLRGEVRNAERRVARFVARSADNRTRTGEDNPMDSWEIWEWQLYREAMGL